MASEPETIYRAPVGSGLLDKMAASGFAPAWANEYELLEGAITLGRDDQGNAALFVFDAVSGRTEGPFRSRPA